MKKIYLVDDDEDDRMLARQALESVIDEIVIIEFSDGGQLLDLIEEGLDDLSLVLMDINMPRITGLEVLSEIKGRLDQRHIPVVIFSTSESPEAVQAAYHLEANAYIVKPVSFEGYIHMAHAVNLCFLNRYAASIPKPNLRSIAGKHVMIIEDNADHYLLMELFLKQGFPALNLIYKSSAASALEFFRQAGRAATTAIDLVILDLYLPNRQQGLDLLTSIREIFKAKNLAAVPIVVLSASDNREDMMASYERQANSYLIKTSEPAKSFSYLTDLCYFWQNTLVSPRKIR